MGLQHLLTKKKVRVSCLLSFILYDLCNTSISLLMITCTLLKHIEMESLDDLLGFWTIICFLSFLC